MEDSLKGILTAMILISLFIVSILSFIVIFPQEQGATFSSGAENNTYIAIQTATGISQNQTQTQINDLHQKQSTSFNLWDITVGFMGSNSLKQSADTNVNNYKASIFDTLRTIIDILFGSGSPIVYILEILIGLIGAYLIYAVIKWVRTGI